MVAQATREFALELMDYNQEYNTKIIILFLIFAYSVFMLSYSNKIAPKEIRSSDIPLKDMILATLLKTFSLPVIILYPLMVISMLFRGYSIIALFNLMLGIYIVVVLVVFVYVFLFGWQKLLEVFGFNSFSGLNKMQFKNSVSRRTRRR